MSRAGSTVFTITLTETGRGRYAVSATCDVGEEKIQAELARAFEQSLVLSKRTAEMPSKAVESIKRLTKKTLLEAGWGLL